MARWLGRRPALKDEHVDELLAIRHAMTTLPFEVTPRGNGVRQLAERWGISLATTRNYLAGRIPKRFGCADGG